MSRTAFLALLALPFLAGGCRFNASSESTAKPPPTSSTIETANMWPSMSAQSDGQTLKVYAALLTNSDFVALDTGDFFVASVKGGESGIVLTREPDTGGAIHYFATFPSPPAAATVTIAFNRNKGFVPAPTSVTTMPAPFSITSSAPGTVKLGSALAVTISPAPTLGSSMEHMTIAVSGTCLQDSNPFPVTFDAAGNASFDTRQLKLVQGATAGCDLFVQIRHEVDGPADPAFENASTNPVLGLQQRGFQTALVL